MSKEAPAFQFYASDYLSSSKVQRMTLEAEGAYIRLLAYSWQDGYIPANVAQMAALCKTTPKKMAVLWDSYLRECFQPMTTDPDKLVNRRLEDVRTAQAEHRQRRSEAGSKGAAKRWQEDGNDIPEPMANDSSSSPSSTPSSKQGNKYSGDFELFWQNSTKRGSKVEAWKVWKAINPNEEVFKAIFAGMMNWRGSEQWQDETKQPHVHRWLKREGWTEIVPRSSNGNHDPNAQAARRLLSRLDPQDSGGDQCEIDRIDTRGLPRTLAAVVGGTDQDSGYADD